MQTHEIESWDGTRLSVFEGGNPDGPPVVLVNGLGGNVSSWQHQIADLGQDYRLINWDYRGLYTSGPATDGRSYSIAAHARDLAVIIDAFGLEAPTLVGWSMGVQVSLEYLRHHPTGAGHLVAINGTPGHPFRTAFGSDLHAQMQQTFHFIERHWTKTTWAMPWVRRRRVVKLFVRTVQALGLASRQLDEDIFRQLAFQFADLDLGVYSRIFNHLGAHDASDVLPTLQVPALLIGGDRDIMTPLHRTLLMAGRIPDADLVTIRGGTHFTPLEFPRRVNREIRRFLSARASSALHHDAELALAVAG